MDTEYMKTLIGKKVKHEILDLDTNEVTYENGVIVSVWHDEVLDCIDCYVTFFGDGMGIDKPKEVPYNLRYLLSSLTIVEEF